MAENKKKTAEEIADELTAIAVEGLAGLSPEEQEKRIRAFEKRVATSCHGTRRAADSTLSSSSRTSPIPVHARDRERS